MSYLPAELFLTSDYTMIPCLRSHSVTPLKTVSMAIVDTLLLLEVQMVHQLRRPVHLHHLYFQVALTHRVFPDRIAFSWRSSMIM